MRVKLFRRLLATLLDLNILFLIVYGMFLLFGNTIIKGQVENYEEHHEIYQQNVEAYNIEVDALEIQLTEGSITQEDFDTEVTTLLEAFNDENEEYAVTEIAYLISVLFFYVFSISFLNYIYNLAMKGQTIGRRIMKIRLAGNITWLSLLVREFLYKGLFWIATLTMGIAVDIGLIAFTKNRQTLRDRISRTYLTYEGVSYPF